MFFSVLVNSGLVWSCFISCLVRARVESYNASGELRLDNAVFQGCPPENRPAFIWDLTNNVTFGCWKAQEYQDLLPCLLRGHRLYHLQRQRVILGTELLRGQGYPSTMVTSGFVKGKEVAVPATRKHIAESPKIPGSSVGRV